MAITLETVAIPGATPIANNGTSEQSFLNNYFKLTEPVVSRKDTKAIIVLALIYSLAATAGRVNYKNQMPALRQDAQVYTGGISKFDPWVAFAATAVSAAKTADATFSLDMATLLNLSKMPALPEQDLDRIIGFLAAQLGI